MKTNFKILVIAVVAGVGLTLTSGIAAETQPAQSGRSPEWILELLKETNSNPNPAEEEAHQSRIRRLYELEKQAQAQPSQSEINEAAGAPRPEGSSRSTGQSSAVPSGDIGERLIEAIEQLQMEIQELNKRLAHQMKEQQRQTPADQSQSTQEENSTRRE